MVREFDYTRDLSCTVWFSVDGMDPTLADSMDKCCSIVRTVCSELTARNINVDFYTNGSLWGIKNRESNIWGCTATQGYDGELLRALALLLPSPARCSANHLAVNAVRASGHHTAYVVVAPARTTAVLQMLDVLKEASVMDVLLVTAEDYPDEAEVSS